MKKVKTGIDEGPEQKRTKGEARVGSDKESRGKEFPE